MIGHKKLLKKNEDFICINYATKTFDNLSVLYQLFIFLLKQSAHTRKKNQFIHTNTQSASQFHNNNFTI